MSPIVSAYAAVTVVCAVLIGGERLGGGETAAIVVVLLGVLLASSDLAQLGALERIALLGILLALATAVLIGVFVYGVAYFSAEYGWLVPIVLARGFSTLFLVAVSLRGGEWRFPDRSPRLLVTIALIAVVDTSVTSPSTSGSAMRTRRWWPLPRPRTRPSPSSPGSSSCTSVRGPLSGPAWRSSSRA